MTLTSEKGHSNFCIKDLQDHCSFILVTSLVLSHSDVFEIALLKTVVGTIISLIVFYVDKACVSDDTNCCFFPTQK